MTIDAEGFREEIYAHYRRNARTFPWRETVNPYRVLVSEFMLQQTGVDRVLQKYGPFLDAFPTVRDLASSSFEGVFSLWRGLGYNRRCRFLKRSAEIVMSAHGGRIPRNLDDLMALPGAGRATASALLSFAWGEPTVFVETNIRRVYLHFFFDGGGRDRDFDRVKVHDRELYPLVEETLDREDPRRFYYALMDYGDMLRRRFGAKNDRSVHYRKQPPFAGSDRQVRGEILRLLLERPGRAPEEIRRRVEATLALPESDRKKAGEPVGNGRLDRILRSLREEGLIVREGGRYRLGR
jgi:A/G-specific adenine glycosylase